MNIITLGRGNIGGGLGRRWQQSGHKVTFFGRDGGDASTADVVLVAVPPGSISDALSQVTGLEGKVAVDATNAFGGRDDTYESLAHEVKVHTKGRSRRPSMRTTRISSIESTTSVWRPAVCMRPKRRHARSRRRSSATPATSLSMSVGWTARALWRTSR